MIDINELRNGVSKFGGSYLTGFGWAALIDRLEAAEKAVTEAYQRGYATGREEIAAELEFAKQEVANLHDDIHELTDERDALRADLNTAKQTLEALIPKYTQVRKEHLLLRTKIERMEKQEPVWFIDERGEPKRYHKSKADYCKYGGLDLLYALPGAKGESE